MEGTTRGIAFDSTRKRKAEAAARDETEAGFEWETAKENVMPLKRGRNVKDLNLALRTHDSFNGKIQLDAQAKEMQERVEAYEGEDPLSGWVEYVRWVETNMPEDTRKKFAALEKATRELKSITRYKDDIRYIRLWIQYADLVSNPKDIFKYLYQNKIGSHVSLFYIGWAWVLESVANYAQANKVYLKAIEKKAQPDDLLNRKYKEFQRRMSRHWLKVNNSADPAQVEDGPERYALGDISSDQADIERIGNLEHFRQYAIAQAEKMQRANAHKPVFQIYEDPAGTEVDTFDGSADWAQLDTMQHQNKENMDAPTPWNNASIGTRRDRPIDGENRIPSPADAEILKVFVDDNFSVPAVLPSTSSTIRERSHSLRQRLEGVTTEEEQLSQKPLKNFGKEKPMLMKPPRDRKAKSGVDEKLMYNRKQLEAPTGEILSFEEVRARKHVLHRNRKRPENPVKSGNRFLATEMSDSSDRAYTRFLQTQQDSGNPAKTRPPSTASNVPHPQIVKPQLGSHRHANAEQRNTLESAVQEDMTINTRVAMEDVNGMFCSPTRETTVPPIVEDAIEVQPVERKLHFSIFDDSTDSIALNSNDVSLRADTADSVDQTSFQIYSDDAPGIPLTAGLQDRTQSSARKPLGLREDLARKSRLTNKDMMMQLQEGHDTEKETTKEQSKRRYPDEFTPEPTKRCIAQNPTKQVSRKEAKEAPLSLCRQITNSVDPYSSEQRGKMIRSTRVKTFITNQDANLVHFHSCKAPALWCQDQQKRILKKTTIFGLDKSTAIETIGFLGSGAFAQVFSVRVRGADSTPIPMAMKYEKYQNNLVWEMYITNEVRTRLSRNFELAEEANPIPKFQRLDIFTNGSLLFMEKSETGTLHDLLNIYRKNGKSFPEALVVYYTIRMLSAIEMLHDADVLHGDVKPDNWLVVPGTCDRVIPLLKKTPRSSAHYKTGDLRLTDFGRAVDLQHFPKGIRFTGDCHVKGFQTVEMLTNQPWTKQIDSFGICGTVHCLLFGEYMEVVVRQDASGGKHWGIKRGFKRYWQASMWKMLFDTLLNVKSCEDQPSLPPLRRRLESYFVDQPHRLVALQDQLASQERLLTNQKI